MVTAETLGQNGRSILDCSATGNLGLRRISRNIISSGAGRLIMCYSNRGRIEVMNSEWLVL